MAGDDRDDFGIGALGSHTNRVHGDRSRATRLQIDEPAMVGQPPYRKSRASMASA
jgi:hypothetical protein